MESANAWEQGRRTNVTDAAPSVDADIVRPPEGDGKKHIVRRSIAALMIAGMTFPVGWTANYWKEAGRMPDPVDVMLNFGDNLIFWS